MAGGVRARLGTAGGVMGKAVAAQQLGCIMLLSINAASCDAQVQLSTQHGMHRASWLHKGSSPGLAACCAARPPHEAKGLAAVAAGARQLQVGLAHAAGQGDGSGAALSLAALLPQYGGHPQMAGCKPRMMCCCCCCTCSMTHAGSTSTCGCTT